MNTYKNHIFAIAMGNKTQAMQKLSAIIPTYNEEINIEAAIRSVSFADEIIIIDSFSTDHTIAIAEKYEVRILQRVFDDFSSQKNYAIENATHKWIVLLDADERIGADLKNEIQTVLSAKPKASAYWVYRRNYLLGREIKYSGWQNDKVIRLIERDFCKYNGKLVHEEITTSKKISYLKTKLEHHTYKDFDNFINKKNKVAQLQAQMLAAKNKKVTPYLLFAKPAYRFVNHYFFKRGFLDGFPGFFIASFYAYTIFTRYIKLWLINKGLK
ncbi:MAG: glycosyltransferase family 2 protein [Flavobacteriales bacterium]|nr:glycosyltransferase family 2 protein [Flavobacteriales bacterium]